MKSAIVIPARFGSSRFVGKPLHPIRGISLLERTWRIACEAGADLVLIATDDERIEAHAKSFGALVVRTSQSCENGTERVWEALNNYGVKPQIVLNLQGDAVLTPPWVLSDLLEAMLSDPSVKMATPATKLSLEEYQELAAKKAAGSVGGTLVVFDKKLNALYFSKAAIPYVRKASADSPLYRHIGLYAYTYETLKEYLALPMSPLEKTEGLEQLRALENCIPIRIVLVDYRGRTHWSVDSPEDVIKVEEIIDAQGELFTLAVSP